jgi:hypothetical protein
MTNTKTLILLCGFAPHPLADALVGGYRVFEALAVSEVFNLVERWPDAQIVVTHDVDFGTAQTIRQHFMTLQLTKDAPIQDVLWELLNLYLPSAIQ